MMKSFFKKLAFVMALAMVVSMAAPAAQASAAEVKPLGIALQDAKSDAEVLTADNVAVNETEDYKYYWAVKEYMSLHPTWKSLNEEVASVTQKGEVTGLKDGVATIEIRLDNGQVGTIEITVGTPVEEVTYEVVQKTDKLAEIVFTGKHEFTTADVALYRVYDGGFTSVWPLEEVKATDNGFSIKPYVNFADGDQYLVKVGTEDEGFAFDTVIARPNRLEVTFKSNDVANKAYYDANTEYPAVFDVKYFYNNIDLTDVWKADAEMTYELTATSDSENVYLDEYEGQLFFNKAGVAASVLAKYTYYDKDNNEVVVPYEIQGIVSEPLPKYEIEGVIDWCIVKAGTAADKIDWSKKDIKANDDASATYNVVLLIQDSYGNKVVTDGTYATSANKYKSATDTAYNFAKEGYYVTYSSTNVGKMLIGEYDASLTTYTEATVPVIIALNNTNQENGDFVRNISAVTVAVKKERTINNVVADKTTVNVTTDGDYVTDSIKLTVFDNYNDLWTQDVALEVSTNIEGVNISGVTFVGGDKATLTFNGATLNGVMSGLNKNSVKVTIKANGKSEVVTVNLKSPRYETVDGVEKIKVTSWNLDATDVDQKLKKSADGTVVKSTVTLYQLSNGLKVGKETDIQLLTKATLTNAETSKGDRYLAVYGTDNKLVTSTSTSDKLAVVDNGDGTFGVVVATANASGTAMQYAPEGTYTVKVVEVNGFTAKNEARLVTKYTDTFKVSNTSDKLNELKQTEIKSESADILSIVKDTLTIKLGANAWDYSTADIAKVEGRYNAGAGYVIITAITFNVPLDGATDVCGYEVKVPVNKSIEVPNFAGSVVNGVFVIE